jgi:hypothetical protein
MPGQYEKNGTRKSINKLKVYPVLESGASIVPFYKSFIRNKSVHELGIGTTHKMKSVFWDIFVPVWTCKAYK